MVIYKPSRGTGLYYILGVTVIYGALIVLGIILVDSYILSSLLKIFLMIYGAYQLYYIVLWFSLKYAIDGENVYILKPLKKIKIPLKEIQGYKKYSGSINGVKLSGLASNTFAIGKSVIKNIGTTSLYVTSNKDIFYIKTKDNNYAMSPEEHDKFEKFLNKQNINASELNYNSSYNASLHKDKFFMIPFILDSIIISIFTLNPFVLYLMDKLPTSMPLNFDSSFIAVEYGTGKQFAFNQMIYGVLNMVILFCMYYASYFYAKYDKKYSKKFIYVSLIISLTFLLIQFRILHTFK